MFMQIIRIIFDQSSPLILVFGNFLPTALSKMVFPLLKSYYYLYIRINTEIYRGQTLPFSFAQSFAAFSRNIIHASIKAEVLMFKEDSLGQSVLTRYSQPSGPIPLCSTYPQFYKD